MLPRTLALLALLALFAIPAQTHAQSEAPYGDLFSTIELGKEIESGVLQRAVIKAAIARRWNIVSKSDERIQLHLLHRGYDATLTLVLQPSTILIHSDSYATNKQGGRKNRKHPVGWIENLQKDIKVFIDRELYL